MSSSLKSIKYEYQHYISSTNGFISINMSIFFAARFKKPPGAVCNWGPISKKKGFPIFFDQRQKSNTQAS